MLVLIIMVIDILDQRGVVVTFYELSKAILEIFFSGESAQVIFPPYNITGYER